MSAASEDADRTHGRRRGTVDRALFAVLYVFGCALFRPLFRMRVIGQLRVPRGRPVILAPNHCSYLDPIVVQAAVPRRVTFLMTEEIYRVPWARWFFRSMGTIPVPGRGVHVKAMRACVDALERGELLVVFPEGRISPDGLLGRGFPGVASIAARAGAVVVPVHIEGTHRALPKHARLVRPTRITVRIGSPIEIGDEAALDRDALRDRSEAIMSAIAALAMR
jgi:1-acyl-sn-glycerol-3-phosphate acyltransferase